MILGLSSRALRGGIMAVIGVDLIALAAFAVHVDERTVTTTTPTAAAAVGAQPPSAVVPPAVAPQVAATTPLGGSAAVPFPQGIGQPASVTPVAPPPPTRSPTAPKPSAPPSSGGGSTPIGSGSGSVPGSKEIPACPVKVAKHDASGGLQSLIPFAGAFGPFKPEAFAAASAYQPLLQLIGPILAEYPKAEPAVGPALTPMLDAFGSLLEKGYQASEPLYGPQREQVVQQETKLATALAPYSQKLAYSKLGGCVVELENALITDTIDAASTKTATTAKKPTKAQIAARLAELVEKSRR